MFTQNYYAEIEVNHKPSPQDILNQLRAASSGRAVGVGPFPPPNHIAILTNMVNKNWEIVEKPNGTHWIRFLDDLTHSEYMLLV